MRETALFDNLVVVDDPEAREAALNMAIDETLLAGIIAMGEAGLPLLRIYRWSGPIVSIGYFENVADARKSFPDCELVRRWTGGGIVLHGQDLTYSLLVPRVAKPAWWQGPTAYREIHECLAAVLREVGFAAATVATDANPASSAISRECFRKPVTYDVLIDGDKIAGAAQRRTRHGLLHQGSIQSGNALPLTAGSSLNADLSLRLPSAFGRHLESRQLTSEELECANRLAASRYATAEWLEKF